MDLAPRQIKKEKLKRHQNKFQKK